MTEVRFFRPQANYGQFSNFYPSFIIIDGVGYPTVEHYFQAAKFLGAHCSKINQDYAMFIARADTPYQAFCLGRQRGRSCNQEIKQFKEAGVQIRSDWDNIKNNVMRQGLWAKFNTEPFRTVLKDTDRATLIETNPKDYYWAVGKNNTGQNMLGLLLMEIRSYLQRLCLTTLTIKSNWVIPHRLIASSYPGNQELSDHQQQLYLLVKHGVRHFISLMDPQEMESLRKYDESLVGEHQGLRDFPGDVHRTAVTRTGVNLTFYRFPITDMNVTTDDRTLHIAQLIANLVSTDQMVLVHCLGGKGRTGTIIGVALGLIYKMRSDQALDLVSHSFQSRMDKGRRCKRSPQTTAQIEQVKRLVDQIIPAQPISDPRVQTIEPQCLLFQQLLGFDQCQGDVPPQPYLGLPVFKETFPNLLCTNCQRLDHARILICDYERDMHVVCYPGFLNNSDANELWNTILSDIPLNYAKGANPVDPSIEFTYPRRMAFMTDLEPEIAKLSGYDTKMQWHPKLLELRTRIQTLVGNAMTVNSALINYYQEPKHKISKHRDKELKPPRHVVIAITLAPYYPRRLVFKEYKSTASGSDDSCRKWTFYPPHGSLYIMEGNVNKLLTHESPALTKTELKNFNYDPGYMQRMSITWRDLS